MHHMTREERMIHLQNLTNVRDLGGYETQEGAYTKSHKYIRAASLCNASKADMRTLFDYGLKVVIDLRSQYECAKYPDHMEDYSNIEFHHIDLFNDPKANLHPTSYDFRDMGDLYCIILDQCHYSLKQVFDVFLKHPYDCVLFHCSAGKDRTGVISALLLDLAGCHEYDIIKDYSESYENNLAIYEQLKELTRDEENLQSTPTYMMKMLNHLRDEYGSAQNYLRIIGFEEEEVEELKNMFIF